MSNFCVVNVAHRSRIVLVKKCANYFLFFVSLDRYSHRDRH